MIEQGIILSDGPPRPCSENPTDMLFEILTTPCINSGYWYGTVNDNVVGSTGEGNGGTYLNFCSGETACLRNWRFCTRPDGSIQKTLVSVTSTSIPPLPSCPATQAPVFPANGVVAGSGVLAGQSFNLNMTSYIPFYDDSRCWLNCALTAIND